MTTEPNLPFDKKPTEAYPIGFQFYDRLPPGAKVTSATVSAYNVTDSQADNSVLQSTTGVVKGTLVKVGVRAGTIGKKYRITCTAILSSNPGDNLIEEREMNIIA